MPALSIVMPVYNAERYMEQCIESIRKQTVRDFELIIVDDGSTDNSGKICDNYAQKDDRICVIHKANGGVASARNIGIGYATSKYLAFVDADDELSYADYFKDLLENPDVDYIVDGFRDKRIYESSQSESISQITPCAGNGISSLPDAFFINGLFHPCWGKRYLTHLIREKKICFPNVRVSEDSLFNLEYMKYSTSWKVLDRCGYCYIHRYTRLNATARFELSDIDTYISLHQKMLDLGIGKSVVNNTLYPQYLACLRKCYRAEESWKGRKKKMKAILAKGQVIKTLLFTKRNLGEWMTGLVYCSCNRCLIDFWNKVTG